MKKKKLRDSTIRIKENMDETRGREGKGGKGTEERWMVVVGMLLVQADSRSRKIENTNSDGDK